MPQTRVQRAEANMARMRAQIDAAISNGEQVQPFSSTQGSFLQVGNRKVKLQNKDGSLTASGEHYWNRVDETPPLMYSYDQPIINNSVMGYNGKRVIVRKRVNGQWQITKRARTNIDTTDMNTWSASLFVESFNQVKYIHGQMAQVWAIPFLLPTYRT